MKLSIGMGLAHRYILNTSESNSAVGNKARQIESLIKRGYRVPRTYYINWDAHKEFSTNGSLGELRSELQEIIDPNATYAIRSSANIEDEKQVSFAGQFDSFLGVKGLDDILSAIQKVWASVNSDRLKSYADRSGIEIDDLKMGIILQEMVPAVISGVSFSRNPLTGLNEVLIEAVRGSGIALVQEGCTPQRWIRKWRKWIKKPDRSDIPISVIEKVADETSEIEKEFGVPIDLEWIFDGKELFWVQVRGITSLDDINIYSNKISREVLPGMIKPLIWSINIPLVNGAWVRLFTEIIGENDIDPESLSKQFYYRVYFNMGVIGRIFQALGMPKDSLEILMGINFDGEEKPKFKPTAQTFLQLPNIVPFAIDKWKFSRKVKTFLPEMWSMYREFAGTDIEGLGDEQVISGIDELFTETQEAAYFNIVVPLLMQICNRILGSQLERIGYDIEKIDITRELDGLSDLDPNFHLSRIHDQYLKSHPELSGGKSLSELRKTPGAEGLCKQIDNFIDKFGHFSDSGTDFSSVPWRENPELVLSMVDRAGNRDSSSLMDFDNLDMPLIRRPLLRLLLSRARKYRLLREQVSSLYTYGYGLFRNYFTELGRRLVERGLLDRIEDIFYLYYDEVRSLFDGSYVGTPEPKILVAKRRREMEESRDVNLPTNIFGENPPPIHRDKIEELRGVPTSRGYYKGPARLIHGTGDFDNLRDGDVIVIPYSDIGWTPLFARAGAVIAESGGILSHSSIVAREYGIPAVVSVDRALDLKDGQVVSVDGFTGVVTLHDENPKNPDISS